MMYQLMIWIIILDLHNVQTIVTLEIEGGIMIMIMIIIMEGIEIRITIGLEGDM